ncbi:MAG: tetratricopeptide repeat protein, partial [Bacteroidota bacterium]
AAFNAYRQATEADPVHILPWLNLGNLASEEEDYVGALAYYEEAERLDPDNGMMMKCMGIALHSTGEFESAMEYYMGAMAAFPQDAELRLYAGGLLREQGRATEAAAFFQEALELEPENTTAQLNLEAIRGGEIQGWHLDMLADSVRNSAFDAALRKAVKSTDLVLDIGTGSGLLAMMAARAGASKVVACEMLPVLADAAATIVEDNGYGEQISILNKKSTHLLVGTDIDGRADVLVSEIVDVGLVGEGVLPTMRHALEQLVKPEAVLIPARARIDAVLVSSPYSRTIHPMNEIAGFDFRSFDHFRPSLRYKQVYLDVMPHTRLSAPFTALKFDFRNLPPRAVVEEPNVHRLKVKVTEDGVLQGVAFWFELMLDDEISFSTAPSGKLIHWGQALHMLEADVEVKAGEMVELEVLQSETLIQFRVV